MVVTFWQIEASSVHHPVDVLAVLLLSTPEIILETFSAILSQCYVSLISQSIFLLVSVSHEPILLALCRLVLIILQFTLVDKIG